MGPLHIVSVISNTQRYSTRYKLYREFEARMQGHNLWTVELAYGNRHFEITDSNNPRHLQVRSHSELWHKENLINLGVKHLLPRDWEYVAWVDADIAFTRPNWVEETVHQLQRYPVVQLMSRISDLNPYYESFQTHKSFGWCYRHEGNCYVDNYTNPRGHWHPGFAWAMRREIGRAHV